MPSEADMQRESTRRQAGRDFFDCMLARHEGARRRKKRVRIVQWKVFHTEETVRDGPTRENPSWQKRF